MKLDLKSRTKKMAQAPASPASTETPAPVKRNGHGDLTPPIADALPAGKRNGEGEPEPLPTEVLPGAFVGSDNYYKVFRKEHPALEAERSVILAAAWNGSGEQVVRAHHVAKFNAEWAGDELVLRRVEQDVAENVRSGEAHERKFDTILNGTDPYLEEHREPKPWTVWDRGQLAAMLVFSLVLLTVDMNSAALTLMNSGLDGFRDHYWRAALFNVALIIGGAFLIKSASNWLTTDQGGRRYAWVISVAAAVSLFVALPVFAKTYARMTIDPIALMTGEAGTTGTANSAWTFALQILTGNLIAGVMWLTAALLIERHRPSIRVENPTWRRVKDDLGAISTLLRKEREKLGLVQAGLTRIEAERHQLITRAVELFKLASTEAQRAQKTSALFHEFLPPTKR
ncbi:MAG: hypothetical protein NT154_30760 [Verrucomicrobia bacterium]|nr:hypothetical protein [Verrucomicrobiota bacterium]